MRRQVGPRHPSFSALAPRLFLLVLLASLLVPVPSGAQEAWELYGADEQSSSIYAVTHQAGLLGFLGHQHAIVPREWSAELCLPDSGVPSVESIPRDAHGTVVIRTASLVIDSDSARALADLGRGPGPEDVSDIQAKMLGPDYLYAEAFPEIALDVDSVAPRDGGSVLASGRLTIRGVTEDVTVPVSVEPSGDSIRVSGTVSIRQTDYGMEPESVLGVVDVADEVDLHFSLLAFATGETCSMAG